MDGILSVMQMKIESLDRHIIKLTEENERVRKCLAEFDQRHDADAARIAELKALLRDVDDHR